MRVLPGAITVFENIVCVIDHTSSCMRRKNASSSGSRAAMSSTGSSSASLKRAVHDSPSAADMPLSSPLDRPSENAKTVDRLMPIVRGLRSSITVLSDLPLLVAPELGLLAAADVAGGRLR